MIGCFKLCTLFCNLIDELRRFCLMINDRWRENALNEKNKLGEEKYAYRIFIGTVLWARYPSTEKLNKFVEKASLDKLYEIYKNEGEGGVRRFIHEVTRELGFGDRDLLVKSIIDLLEKAYAKYGGFVNFLKDVMKRYSSASQLEEYLRNQFRGLGSINTAGLIRDLRLADIITIDISDLDYFSAEPVIRVLLRTGIIEDKSLLSDINKRIQTRKEISDYLRKIFNTPPITLDSGLYYIGSNYCIRDNPRCDIYPLTHVCPKLTI